MRARHCSLADPCFQALVRSRRDVEIARKEVHILEREAQEERRAADKKAHAAKGFRKTADKLGKH